MARFYEIENRGVRTCVDEYQYEAIYKPKGWKIERVTGGAPDPVPTSPTDEAEIKNLTRMKRTPAKKKFDDNLIKEE